MINLNKKQSGFTIVELLIVIVVIGILAGLVITTFSGIQQKARDTERETDIKALHGQIEAFWAQKGYYPSLTDMNSQAAGGFVATNLKGLDADSFKDPKGSSNALVTAPAANAYAYAVTNAAGTTCEADDTTCAKYVLTATLEGTLNGSSTFVKNSLN
ncbi:MAG: fimbrial protein pilin [Candidatus Saccharibacteria bacterium]|nr:fimbrial protein pilin [Candidatus Saccharibacteria bacterium]